MFTEQRHDPAAVTNIEWNGSESPRRVSESLKIPQCVALGAEEYAAHVVVRADDVVTLAVEILHGFRTDKTVAPCHQDVPALQQAPLRPSFLEKLRRFLGRGSECIEQISIIWWHAQRKHSPKRSFPQIHAHSSFSRFVQAGALPSSLLHSSRLRPTFPILNTEDYGG